MRAALPALLIVGCGGLMSDPPDDPPDTSVGIDASRDVVRDVRVDTIIDAPTTGCGPRDAGAFVSWPVKPTKPPSDACSEDAVVGYYSACLDPVISSTGKCSMFVAANKACASCVMTNQTDAEWGPLVQGKGVIRANVVGCIALQTGDLSKAGCAYKFQAQLECADFVCNTICPTDWSDYQACIADAYETGCSTYASAAETACSPDAAPAAQTCLEQKSFKDYYDVLVRLFCTGGG